MAGEEETIKRMSVELSEIKKMIEVFEKTVLMVDGHVFGREIQQFKEADRVVQIWGGSATIPLGYVPGAPWDFDHKYDLIHAQDGRRDHLVERLREKFEPIFRREIENAIFEEKVRAKTAQMNVERLEKLLVRETKIKNLVDLLSAMRGETGLEPIIDEDDTIEKIETYEDDRTNFFDVIVSTTRPDESFDVRIVVVISKGRDKTVFFAYVRSSDDDHDPLFERWTSIGRFENYEDVVMKIYEI